MHGSGTVTVPARSGGTGVSVVVDDEGVLPDGDPEAMFRRRSPAARGTGIGLALARSLAEADGARLLAGALRGRHPLHPRDGRVGAAPDARARAGLILPSIVA